MSLLRWIRDRRWWWHREADRQREHEARVQLVADTLARARADLDEARRLRALATERDLYRLRRRRAP